MKITATVTLHVELTGGESVEVTTTVERDAGGNPRFLRSEAVQAIQKADRFALDALCSAIPGAQDALGLSAL